MDSIELRRLKNREAAKRYREANREKCNERSKAYHKKRYDSDREKYCALSVARQKAWREANPELYKKRNIANAKLRSKNDDPNKVKTYRRAYHYKRRYGISVEALELMINNQNGCAVCSAPQSITEKGWHLDHCHKTGKIREILCQQCNHALGNVNDSIPRLEQLISYLRKHQT